MRIWNDFFQRENGFSGNPVRQDLLGIESKRVEAIQHLDEKKDLTGSGWKSWGKKNESIKKGAKKIVSQNVQIIWQCGKLYFEDYKKHNASNVQVFAL
jgi:UDP-N-acetylglucosamine--N-acetylmuramyl-(pentapeptide) pyrophosphoryl-undecaprenol N-acetylglucosamine transferase